MSHLNAFLKNKKLSKLITDMIRIAKVQFRTTLNWTLINNSYVFASLNRLPAFIQIIIVFIWVVFIINALFFSQVVILIPISATAMIFVLNIVIRIQMLTGSAATIISVHTIPP